MATVKYHEAVEPVTEPDYPYNDTAITADVFINEERFAEILQQVSAFIAANDVRDVASQFAIALARNEQYVKLATNLHEWLEDTIDYSETQGARVVKPE